MATYTDSGIQFTNVKQAGLPIGNCPIYIPGFLGIDSDDGGIMNASNIDWNGAVLPDANISTAGSVTINTTGQLLNLINEMQKEIYVLSAAVIAIGTK